MRNPEYGTMILVMIEAPRVGLCIGFWRFCKVGQLGYVLFLGAKNFRLGLGCLCRICWGGCEALTRVAAGKGTCSGCLSLIACREPYLLRTLGSMSSAIGFMGRKSRVGCRAFAGLTIHCRSRCRRETHGAGWKLSLGHFGDGSTICMYIFTDIHVHIYIYIYTNDPQASGVWVCGEDVHRLIQNSQKLRWGFV